MAVVALAEHVQQTLRRERAQVAARLGALQEQSLRLHTLVDQLDCDMAETGRLLRQMDEMLGDARQLSLSFDGELRGRELQRVAVELLRREQGNAAGFLTQVSRAPGVESIRPRSGLYRLRSA
jgi:hypothetical protein